MIHGLHFDKDQKRRDIGPCLPFANMLNHLEQVWSVYGDSFLMRKSHLQEPLSDILHHEFGKFLEVN